MNAYQTTLVISTLAWSLNAAAISRPNSTKTDEQTATKKRVVETLRLAKKEASTYTIHLESDSKPRLTLHPKSILRWSNPVGGTVHGEFFVWTHNGCPRVVASIYHYYSPKRYLATEFHSLTSAKLSATYSSQQVWAPATSGVQFKEISGVSTPSETARARLRQMREAARSFKVEFTNRKGEKEQLRLLTQPSYRYKSTDPTVLDGALFVFAQGTNPETVLLIEARQTNNGYRWQFAFARQTGHELNAFYKDRRVWNVPPAIGEDKLKRTAPYTVFYRYPQADTAS